MSYKRSSARDGFEAETALILGVMDQANPSTSAGGDYILSCGILFCSAKIESYIEDIFDLISAAFLNASVTASKLPESLRAYLFGLEDQIVANYSHYTVYRDEKRLISGLTEFFNNNYSALADPNALLPKIHSKRIYKGCKYPSPNNLKALFGRLGIDIFHELNRRASRDVELDLTSFNSLRTSLAHTALAPSINARDIKRHIGRMRKLISLIDRVLYGFTCKTIGEKLWLKVICK